MAGLRIVDAFMAVCMACAYRHVLLRMIARRFAAKGSDVMGGGLAVLSCGMLLQTVFGLTLILTKGHVPADAVLWSRLLVGGSYFATNIGFTIIFAGLTMRAWSARGVSPAVAARQAEFTYYRLASITIGMMATGWALALVHGG
jgi:hypothetical protein